MTDHQDTHLDVAPQVAAALEAGQPVVALESTIISHGMPSPRNVETALDVENAVRKGGAIPATIAVLGGRLRVGLDTDEIEHLGETGTDVVKCSRRDLPFAVARRFDGATVKAGSGVLEAFARHTDKGTALMALASDLGTVTTVFLGDDLTDEEAFAHLSPGDVAIKVGDADTIAPHRLADPPAVLTWLRALSSTGR